MAKSPLQVPNTGLVSVNGKPLKSKEEIEAFTPSDIWQPNPNDPTEHAHIVAGSGLMLQVKQMPAPQPCIALFVNLAEQKAIAQPFPNIVTAYEFAEFIINALRYEPSKSVPVDAAPDGQTEPEVSE